MGLFSRSQYTTHATRLAWLRFSRQLQQLRDMGFYDTEQCLAALQATSGNVNAAIDRLLQ